MPDPRYMGGQAVMEGVMMRGARTWAVAVRTPDGEIEVAVHDAPTWAERWSKIPLVRGVDVARRSRSSLGFKALAWSADRQLPEEERISSKAMGWTMAVALVFFTGDLHRAPRARRPTALGDVFGVDGFCVPPARGRASGSAIFLGYLVLIGLLPDIKRVFQYHGAEHKAIAAYENDVELTPEAAQQFTTAARALRHQLPAHRDGRHDRRVLVRRPPVAAVADRSRGSCSSRSSPGSLRGHPVRGPAHGQALGADR